jgi:hypothetical protein
VIVVEQVLLAQSSAERRMFLSGGYLKRGALAGLR